MKVLSDLLVTSDDDHLLVQAWQQDFQDFCNGYEIPKRLITHLKTQGYKPDESNGLLFSGCGNVNFHCDDVTSKLSAVWCLSARYDTNSPVLIAGGKYEPLVKGSVLVFDPTKNHAVLAETNKPYLIYVLNVRRIR